MRQSRFVDYHQTDDRFLSCGTRTQGRICVPGQQNMESCFWQMEKGLFHTEIPWRTLLGELWIWFGSGVFLGQCRMPTA